MVIEEPDGEEFSLLPLLMGTSSALCQRLQDHKRAYDGDKVPNTGGMGAYAPVSSLALQSVVDTAVDTYCPSQFLKV